jgi:ABC-type cobalamin transport system ATPase subunit
MPATITSLTHTARIALAIHGALQASGRMKRIALEQRLADMLGTSFTDQDFEAGVAALGRKVIRVRGQGGFFALS